MTWVFELKDEREIISPIITLRWRMETADLDSVYRLFGLRPTVRHAVYSTYDDIHEWWHYGNVAKHCLTVQILREYDTLWVPRIGNKKSTKLKLTRKSSFCLPKPLVWAVQPQNGRWERAVQVVPHQGRLCLFRGHLERPVGMWWWHHDREHSWCIGGWRTGTLTAGRSMDGAVGHCQAAPAPCALIAPMEKCRGLLSVTKTARSLGAWELGKTAKD